MLKTITKVIDPEAQSELTINFEHPFIVIDIDCPDIADSKTRPVYVANTNEYEKAVAKNISSDFYFDTSRVFQPGKRTFFYLDKLTGTNVDTAPKYNLTITFVEFPDNL